MAKNTVTHTINGKDYVCFPWSFTLACASRGPNCIMAVSAAAAAKDEEPKGIEEMTRKEFLERIELMKGDLQQVMVKPRLVEHYTEDENAVTWQEMGDDFAALHRAVTRQETDDIVGFPESSEDRTE